MTTDLVTCIPQAPITGARKVPIGLDKELAQPGAAARQQRGAGGSSAARPQRLPLRAAASARLGAQGAQPPPPPASRCLHPPAQPLSSPRPQPPRRAPGVPRANKAISREKPDGSHPSLARPDYTVLQQVRAQRVFATHICGPVAVRNPHV